MERIIKMAEAFTNAFGAPGFEDDVLEEIKKYVSKMKWERDSINNLFVYLGEQDEKKPTVLLDCHSDEVGFMVEHINDNGSLRFLPLGGWHVGNLPAMSVVIKNNKGEYIPGVVASKPPHFMTEEERSRLPKLSELSIDIGTNSYEETINLYGIEVGNPVVPEVRFSYDEKISIMRAKAFDNRLGTVAAIEVLKQFQEMKINLDVNLIVSVSSQEEVGLRGAQVAAQRIQPDFVIVFEGSPADDSFQQGREAKGKLRGGVQLRALDAAMISNSRVLEFAKKIAREKEIPFQMIVREKGSTNGGKYHITGKGIPTLVLGIPTRYAHTSYCYASLADTKAAVDLAREVVQELNREKIETF